MNDRDRFDKFTERARKVLSLAQEEAQRFQHNYIGTEHLLLGLVREGEGGAAKVLNNLGVELIKVRSAVEFIIGRGERIGLGGIGITPRAKKVIEIAVDEAGPSDRMSTGPKSDRDKFDKFTPRSRKVLSMAQEEAQRLQHNYIGTEHLLLGLVRENEGGAAKLLNNLGLDIDKARGTVQFII